MVENLKPQEMIVSKQLHRLKYNLEKCLVIFYFCFSLTSGNKKDLHHYQKLLQGKSVILVIANLLIWFFTSPGSLLCYCCDLYTYNFFICFEIIKPCLKILLSPETSCPPPVRVSGRIRFFQSFLWPGRTFQVDVTLFNRCIRY